MKRYGIICLLTNDVRSYTVKYENGMLRLQQTEFRCTLVKFIPIVNVNRLPVSTVNCAARKASTCSKVRIVSAIPAESKQEHEEDGRHFGMLLWAGCS